MSWDAVIFGNMQNINIETWLDHIVDSTNVSYCDLLSEKIIKNKQVKEILLDIENYKADMEFVKILFDRNNEITIYSLFTKNEYLYWAVALTSLYEASAKLGAIGNLYYLGYRSANFGFELSIKAEKCIINKILKKDISKLKRHDLFRRIIFEEEKMAIVDYFKYVMEGDRVSCTFIETSEETIESIEKDLSVTLPDSYKWFLKHYGECIVEGIAILGAKSSYKITLEKRTSEKLPKRYFALHYNQQKYFIDTGKNFNGECPIVFKNPDSNRFKRCNDNFINFLFFLVFRNAK